MQTPIYAKLSKTRPLVPADDSIDCDTATLTRLQKGFGYTREDVKMILQPMAADGKDAVWSMGDDTPLAFLARTPRPVYAYFRQRFAQVTNPPIDSLRESDRRLAAYASWARGPTCSTRMRRCPASRCRRRFSRSDRWQPLRGRQYPHARRAARSPELPCVFASEMTLIQALDDLCMQAIELVRNGARMLLLTDRSASPEKLPIPMAMATGAVHQALVSGWSADAGRPCGRGGRLPRHSSCRCADRLRSGCGLPVACARDWPQPCASRNRSRGC